MKGKLKEKDYDNINIYPDGIVNYRKIDNLLSEWLPKRWQSIIGELEEGNRQFVRSYPLKLSISQYQSNKTSYINLIIYNYLFYNRQGKKLA